MSLTKTQDMAMKVERNVGDRGSSADFDNGWQRGCRDKLFLKCHIQLNQLWFLMQCSLISGYFHYFTEERTMMLKVFPDDDLGSKTHDRKKE
ncbi:hypothetical protein GW17_00058890 [Ensete ventricosum]|nr:hypothetical protein GW17_00058890 [Ensete ventricosum]